MFLSHICKRLKILHVNINQRHAPDAPCPVWSYPSFVKLAVERQQENSIASIIISPGIINC